MDFREKETAMWETAKNCDASGFLECVSEDAVMVCGGYRCSGKEYSHFISEYDIAEYEFKAFEVVLQTDDICQIHYVVATKINNECKHDYNSDLEGVFHVTTTWRKINETWKIVFNMDSRIIEE